MDREIGLWIDHKEAVIVILTETGREIIRIASGIEKHVRFRGGARPGAACGAQFFPPETQKDRQFRERLKKFYDEVIRYIRDADRLLIFGPGQAKLELEKQLAHDEFRGWIAGVESAGRMTDRQIVAKVRGYFLKQLA